MGHCLPVAPGGLMCTGLFHHLGKAAQRYPHYCLGTGPFVLDHSGHESGPQKNDDAGIHRGYCRIHNLGHLDCHVLPGTGLAVRGQIHWTGGSAAAAFALGTAVALRKQHGKQGVQCTGMPVLEPGVAGPWTSRQSGFAELFGSAQFG